MNGPKPDELHTLHLTYNSGEEVSACFENFLDATRFLDQKIKGKRDSIRSYQIFHGDRSIMVGAPRQDDRDGYPIV